MLASLNQISDTVAMPRKIQPNKQWTGLYYARVARGMTRSELVEQSGISKQQLSRLENGVIRLRLDHLKPFATALGYTPEQMLLWGRYPGTEGQEHAQKETQAAAHSVPELDGRGGASGGGKRNVRKDGRHTDPLKT